MKDNGQASYCSSLAQCEVCISEVLGQVKVMIMYSSEIQDRWSEPGTCRREFFRRCRLRRI